MRKKEEIIEQFNQIEWHDSELVSLTFFTSGSEELVRASLCLVGEGDSYFPAEITFHDCGYFQADVHSHAKHQCGGDISGAECFALSEWKTAVSKPSPHDPIRGGRGLEEYLHFKFWLCPTSGMINILARDFSLETKSK